MKVKVPGMNDMQNQAVAANTRIAQAAEERAAESDRWYKENILPRVMTEMERSGRISEESYNLGRKWGEEDRGRLDDFYRQASEYDPVSEARAMATGLKGRAATDFDNNYAGMMGGAIRGLNRTGRSVSALAPDMAGAALAKTKLMTDAERAGLMTIQAAKAEKLNVMANASGRSNPGAGMGLAMQGASMGQQGLGFAQNSYGQNNSSWGSMNQMAMGGWNNVGAMGSAQQSMKFTANQANASAVNGMIGGVAGGLMGGAATAAAGGATGGLAAMFGSDRRLKTGVVKIGQRPDGLGVYQWNYVWGGPRMTGVMADEVRKKYPDAVARFGGFDMVDYSKLGGAHAGV